MRVKFDWQVLILLSIPISGGDNCIQGRAAGERREGVYRNWKWENLLQTVAQNAKHKTFLAILGATM